MALWEPTIWILVFMVINTQGNWVEYNSLKDDGVYWKTAGECYHEVKRIVDMNPGLRIRDWKCKQIRGMITYEKNDTELLIAKLQT